MATNEEIRENVKSMEYIIYVINHLNHLDSLLHNIRNIYWFEYDFPGAYITNSMGNKLSNNEEQIIKKLLETRSEMYLRLDELDDFKSELEEIKNRCEQMLEDRKSFLDQFLPKDE